LKVQEEAAAKKRESGRGPRRKLEEEAQEGGLSPRDDVEMKDADGEDGESLTGLKSLRRRSEEDNRLIGRHRVTDARRTGKARAHIDFDLP